MAQSTTPATTPPTAQAASGYFIDQKKGEVNELKQVTFSVLLLTNYHSTFSAVEKY